MERENALLRKENELLKKENELLKREIMLLKAEAPGAGGSGSGSGSEGPVRTTRDDVVYEFVSITMDGNQGTLKLAITARKPDKVLNTQGIRLVAPDGTEHAAPRIGVLRDRGLQTGRLPQGVRTIVEFRIGQVPDEVDEFSAIVLPGVYGSGAMRKSLANPVMLKGRFKVDRP